MAAWLYDKGIRNCVRQVYSRRYIRRPDKWKFLTAEPARTVPETTKRTGRFPATLLFDEIQARYSILNLQENPLRVICEIIPEKQLAVVSEIFPIVTTGILCINHELPEVI